MFFFITVKIMILVNLIMTVIGQYDCIIKIMIFSNITGMMTVMMIITIVFMTLFVILIVMIGIMIIFII